MENRITRKVDTYLTSFKQDVKKWFEKNEADIAGPSGKSEFLKFIFDYDALTLSKDDFSKRKRVKNTVPCQLRCCAKRANGEQCTRRRKDGEEFCGTHIKGTPYGKIISDKNDVVAPKKRDVWVQEIKGIQYFIDNEQNVYLHDDILANKHNPTVIATYSKVGEVYNITKFVS